MKLNKSKNKGKVHPSPSSSSSPANNDPISSLNHLLPNAILTLISVLSLQDREVLAYLITHSLKSSTLNYPSSSSSLDQKLNPKKKSNRKLPSSTSATSTHKSPSFDCDCFDCYTSYWYRWDSSPHREIINQAIESFEEHLSSSEKTKKKKNGSSSSSAKSSSKKKEKMGCSSAKMQEIESSGSPSPPSSKVLVVSAAENANVEREMKSAPEVLVHDDVEGRENGESPVAGEEERESGTEEKELQQQQQQHKGLARKVLPDFIGFFESRLWNRLWGPNV